MAFVSPFTPSTSFFFMCQKVLPLVYDDSLSYYEVLCKMRDYINTDIEKYNELGQAFNELVDYINNYFSDENIQEVLEPVIEEVVQQMIGTASADTAGMVKVGEGLSITQDGVLNNNNPTPYTLPSATTTTKGGVAVGEGLHLAADGYTLVNDNPTVYTLPTASADTKGGVKASSTLNVASDGTATVPSASTTVEGVVKYTAPIYKNDNGQLSVNYATTSTSGVVRAGDGMAVDNVGTLTLRPASQSAVGGVKSGTGLTVANDGTMNLIPATANTIGGVKAGAGVSISQEGTISVTSGGVADAVEWNNVLDKPATFPVNIATTNTVGGVKTGTGVNSGIDVDANGAISINDTYMANKAATPAALTAEATARADADTTLTNSLNQVTAALEGKVNTSDVIDIAHGGTGASTADNALTALGAVPTTGGTMTGNLIMDGGAKLTAKANDIDIATTPSSVENQDVAVGTDKNGNIISFMRSVQDTSGNTGVEFDARRTVDSTTYFNGVTFKIASDGTRSVSVTDSSAWRLALDAVNKAGDTMTGDLTAPNYIVKGSASGVVPAVMGRNQNGSSLGTIDFLTNGQVQIRSYNVGVASENYLLPVPTTTTGAQYSILTTKGTVTISQGGTGASTVAGARNALGLGNTSGAVPVANGGTGATTAAGARENLGITFRQEGSTLYINVT